jgi:hypothetical protein
MSDKPFKFNEERKFGVEFEVINKTLDSKNQIKEKLVEANILFNEEGYMHNIDGQNFNIWTIKSDSSINSEFGGFEIVSPVLKGWEGIKKVEQVCNILVQFCSVNKSTGFHVHHEIVDFNNGAFKNLFNFYKSHNSIINFLVSKSRRENRYAQCPKNDHIGNRKGATAIKRALIYGNRYRAVNFQSYAVRGTVEFRQHQGTVEAKKAISWILLTQSMVELAKNKKSVAEKRQDNMMTLSSFFRTLGWIPKYIDENLLEIRSYIKDRYNYFKEAEVI